MDRVNDRHPMMDSAAPHNIDHLAYAEGTPRNDAIASLEEQDPFWQTLGGNEDDPFGDGGETFRQRAEAIRLGIGLNVYRPMGLVTDQSQNSDSEGVRSLRDQTPGVPQETTELRAFAVERVKGIEPSS